MRPLEVLLIVDPQTGRPAHRTTLDHGACSQPGRELGDTRAGGLHRPADHRPGVRLLMQREGWPQPEIDEHQNIMRAVFTSLPGDGYFVRVRGMFHLNLTDYPSISPPDALNRRHRTDRCAASTPHHQLLHAGVLRPSPQGQARDI